MMIVVLRKKHVMYLCLMMSSISSLLAKRNEAEIQQMTLQKQPSSWVSPLVKIGLSAAPLAVGGVLYAIKKTGGTRWQVPERMISHDRLSQLCLLSSTLCVASILLPSIYAEMKNTEERVGHQRHEAQHKFGYTVSSALGIASGLTLSVGALYVLTDELDDASNKKLKLLVYTAPWILGSAHNSADAAFKYKYPYFTASEDSASTGTTFWLWGMNFLRKCCYNGCVIPAAIELFYQYLCYTGQIIPAHQRRDECLER